MIDHRALQEAMVRTLQTFVNHQYIDALEIERTMDPRKPASTRVHIRGQLNLTDFAMGVAMELDGPGSLDVPPVNADALLAGKQIEDSLRAHIPRDLQAVVELVRGVVEVAGCNHFPGVTVSGQVSSDGRYVVFSKGARHVLVEDSHFILARDIADPIRAGLKELGVL
jgi:hypothetical protein